MKKLMNLIEVRKIIALAITALFIALALMGRIDMKLVEYVVTTVIAFYFAKSTALDTPKQENTKGE
ncbi:hypothetical protein JCM17380_24960 [Desulfosporosinus burensis]